MAERKDIEETSGKPAAEIKADLPVVDSPPLSPGAEMQAAEPVKTEPAASAPETESITAPTDTAEPAAKTHIAMPRFALPRIPPISAAARRGSVLAASVTFAAAIGAVAGALAGNGYFASPANIEIAAKSAAQDERKAMQASIAELNDQLAKLKTTIETTKKSATAQTAKITERAAIAPADITGSIPTPLPRPPANAAPPGSTAMAKATVVRGWVLRDVRDGIVLVEGASGIYEVVRGAPLPGLGPVEAITRLDGRWVVITPSGIITRTRDRAYFERM